MARKEIDVLWDRQTRNDLNNNFEELYDDLGNIVDKVSDEAYKKVVDSAKLIWKEPVGTYDDLSTLSPGEGWAVMVRDTGVVYRYNGSDWLEIQQIEVGPINEVDERLQSEINTKETPSGAQAKADEARDVAKDYVDLLRSDVYNVDGKVIKIEEQGANEFGEYIRYSDGTQICWGMNVSTSVEVESGALFRSEGMEVTFPKSFIIPANINVLARTAGIGRWVNITSTTNISANLYIMSSVASSASYVCRLTALGRWK